VDDKSNFFRVDSSGDVLLEVKVVPRASADRVAGIEGQHLKIRITAPPVDGKANVYLLRFLAGHFAVRTAQLSLISGEGSRLKRIRVTGLSCKSRAALLHKLSVIGEAVILKGAS
jgi:uncharacterized protein